MASTSPRTGSIGETAADIAGDAKDYARDHARDAADSAKAELEALREKVETLMRDRVTPAVANMAGRAEEAAHGAMDVMRRQTGAVGATVREQPIAALGVVALVGVAIGLLLRR